MARAQVTVRDAVAQDMAALLEVFAELREAGPRRMPGGGGDAASLRAVAEARYRKAIEDPDQRLLVAVDDKQQILGMTLLVLGTANMLLDSKAVMMHHFAVRAHNRRQGVGRALVAAATAWADERGVEGVGVTVYPASRESNRFYARLGFAPVSIVRLAPVAGLRRRLGGEVSAAGLDADDGARRRRLRGGVTNPRSLTAIRRQSHG